MILLAKKYPRDLSWISAHRMTSTKASLLQTPQQALAICKIPKQAFSMEFVKDSLTICLDTIQDPGNLGTIIRIADWFGIKNIFASPETVDVYNPKTIQATMGAIFRVNVFYTGLPALITEVSAFGLPVFGAFMEGENILQPTAAR